MALPRDHARARPRGGRSEDTPASRAAATARVIDYYQRTSAAADLQIKPGRLRIAAAFGLPRLNPPAHPSPAAALCALATASYTEAIDQATRGLACWLHITSHCLTRTKA